MKKICLSIFVLLNMLSTTVLSQAPDLSKFTNDNDKIKAWLGYCAELRLNKNGAKDNYITLQQAGLKGLELVKADQDSVRASFFLFTALGCYYQLKFDSAQYYFYQSLHTAQQVNATKLIAASCEALMSLNFQLQQLDKMEASKNILQTIADTTKDNAILQNIYAAFGSYYQQKSYYSTAQDYYIKSIELRERDVDTTQNEKVKFDYAIQCDQLSKLYLNTQMADKSLAYLRKGERFADISPVVSNRLLSSFVEAFTTSNNIDSALFYYNRLVAHSKDHPEFSSELISSNLNIGLFYIDHKQYNKALPYINKGDSLATDIKSPFLIFQAQMIEGRYFQETGNYTKAISLLTEAIPVALQLDKGLYSNILKYMALSYEGMGNTNSALQYYEHYVILQDTLNKEKVSRTFADLETRYQTNEKQDQIISLDQKNKLNVLELKQASNTKALLILGLVSLGIFSLLLYFIYRNKEKLNKILNQRNQQLDELNNELSVANDTKAKLFGVISHDLRTPVSSIVQLLHLQKENPGYFTDALRKQYNERLNKASENVLETMEDLLLWSKSQMSNFVPQYKLIKIKPLLLQEMELLDEQVREKALRVHLNVSSDISMNTDENFIVVILRNLVQNAIKVSNSNGEISIDADAAKITITNAVSDKSAEELNLILQQNQVSSKYSGLGLQIVKDLAVRLGIEIYFQRGQNDTMSAIILLS
ncbi:MAG: tetratricopeptide repeat-containing sensor histidine kinase [Bacteroidota bacterium]|nr:tetratricopeptide repeat-containing sensor histidine kinase [Bacteroidota bacterium]